MPGLRFFALSWDFPRPARPSIGLVSGPGAPPACSSGSGMPQSPGLPTPLPRCPEYSDISQEALPHGFATQTSSRREAGLGHVREWRGDQPRRPAGADVEPQCSRVRPGEREKEERTEIRRHCRPQRRYVATTRTEMLTLVQLDAYGHT
ncbi:Fc.00g114820.m01.CDS01, partial [Cosmosporella sp. VM-42]